MSLGYYGSECLRYAMLGSERVKPIPSGKTKLIGYIHSLINWTLNAIMKISNKLF